MKIGRYSFHKKSIESLSKDEFVERCSKSHFLELEEADRRKVLSDGYDIYFPDKKATGRKKIDPDGGM
jgi:hypothetical protein